MVFGYHYEEDNKEEGNGEKKEKRGEENVVDDDDDIDDDIDDEVNQLFGLDDIMAMAGDGDADDKSDDDVNYLDELKQDVFFREIVMCKLEKQSRRPYYAKLNRLFQLVLDNPTIFHVIMDSQLIERMNT